MGEGISYTPDTVENLSSPTDSACSERTCYLTVNFTLGEISSALKSRRDTATGLDWLSYKMFKFLDTKKNIIFLDILNLLWSSSIIPKEWKTESFVPILKAGKDKNSPDSYRPVTLTSCVGKIFEQLLKQRLEYFIESNSILPQNQFGFRRGRSAQQSLSHLFLDIQNATGKQEYLASVFFDLIGAFNNVNLNILSSILTSLNIPGKIVNWIFNFLHGQEVFVKFKNRLSES